MLSNLLKTSSIILMTETPFIFEKYSHQWKTSSSNHYLRISEAITSIFTLWFLSEFVSVFVSFFKDHNYMVRYHFWFAGLLISLVLILVFLKKSFQKVEKSWYFCNNFNETKGPFFLVQPDHCMSANIYMAWHKQIGPKSSLISESLWPANNRSCVLLIIPYNS